MAGPDTLEFTEANFNSEVEASDLPVLVDFWATWCGPCRAVGPVVDEIATEFQGRLKVGKVNVDESPSVAGKFGITSIPALFVFKGGSVVETVIGARPKRDLIALLEPHL